MPRSVERIRRPVNRRRRRPQEDGEFQNQGYSKKSSHKERSIANHPRKKSKRR